LAGDIEEIVGQICHATDLASYAEQAPQLETIPQTLARVGESLTDRLTIEARGAQADESVPPSHSDKSATA
jgi:hypothetical protein